MTDAGRRINYLDGATYAGWLGAGALGQQEAAKSAAAAAIKVSFMSSMSLFWLESGMKRTPDCRQTSRADHPCKAKDEQPVTNNYPTSLGAGFRISTHGGQYLKSVNMRYRARFTRLKMGRE